MEPSRMGVIKELEKAAESVRKLKTDLEKEGRRQRRPIVIEFSGAPKSGKTSCINSLAMFLKRNGFSVKIVQERAGVCPVNDKESPMFNIWTACTSIAGMLGIIENELECQNCDILILDRGIFDAICWLEWMTHKQKIELTQRDAIEKFLLMDELVKKIDIVFSFTVNPEISIAREYATLLTNKLGRIMNPQVLDEFLTAINETVKTKSRYFHKVFQIDTSDINQDAVSKQVTDNTLEALNSLFMERIGFLSSDSDFMKIVQKANVTKFADVSQCIPPIEFELRDNVENHPSRIQPVPILVLTDQERAHVLVVKKSSKAAAQDSPEADKLLLYVGGHCRNEDATAFDGDDFLSICRFTLKREMHEEIDVRLALDDVEPFIIYSPTSDKSKRHVAICFVKTVDIEQIKPKLNSYELIQNRGTSPSGRFQSIEFILRHENELEDWSSIILKECFDTPHMKLF